MTPTEADNNESPRRVDGEGRNEGFPGSTEEDGRTGVAEYSPHSREARSRAGAKQNAGTIGPDPV